MSYFDGECTCNFPALLLNCGLNFGDWFVLHIDLTWFISTCFATSKPINKQLTIIHQKEVFRYLISSLRFKWNFVFVAELDSIFLFINQPEGYDPFSPWWRPVDSWTAGIAFDRCWSHHLAAAVGSKSKGRKVRFLFSGKGPTALGFNVQP